ncbi:glutathionine S-transferase [Enterobacter cancerogenus]|uniref:Glutathionine S-transferase n=1 Tax=Enterobacter cancerogenus TaxID=69218 RepID=A0A484Z5P3_9ENTR|nr:glutathionine S-transferase [Enterobacter cancerogenus]
MQFLADNVPDRQLLAPTGSIARYKTLEWLNYIATELHKGFTPLFRPDTPEEYKPTVRALLEKKLQYINDSLKDDQWISGARFTIADAYLFTVLRWARAVKLNMDGLDHVAAYMTRVGGASGGCRGAESRRVELTGRFVLPGGAHAHPAYNFMRSAAGR